MTNTGTDYYYLRAWGHMMGSDASFVSREIEAARAAEAPRDAIYRRDDGAWATFGDVTDRDTRVTIGRILREEAGQAGAEIHKATPAPEFAEDAASVCVHCHRDIKRVPGGHGPTWVHSDTGAVVGHGPPDHPDAQLDVGQMTTDPCPDCQGSGERVINPEWPSGTEPYSENCPTCSGMGDNPNTRHR